MRLCQTNRWGLPEYNNDQVESVFHVNVIVTGTFIASGTGKNKKQAEQDAAKNMLAILKGLGYVI
jgi:dsRNA-specific ribonuclease